MKDETQDVSLEILMSATAMRIAKQRLNSRV